MKNVVITGSTRGIGLAMARAFLKAGCCVTLSGRGEIPPPNLQDELANTDRCIYIPCDVQKKASLQQLWDLSVHKWGTIDIWINNAGQNTPFLPVTDTGEHFVADVITTNLTGMIYGSQVAAVGMIAQKRGAIYSMEGLGSNNMIQEKTILYGTTKHALTYFMKGLAKELEGTGVVAGRLSPGMMLTDFITRSPDGQPAAIEYNESFRRIFNILADRPETVAAYFIPRMLANTKNNVQIAWLTGGKAVWRFMMAPFNRRRLV